MSSPRVLIVDDHQLFRSGVRSELERHWRSRRGGAGRQAVKAIESDDPSSCSGGHMPDGAVTEELARGEATCTPVIWRYRFPTRPRT